MDDRPGLGGQRFASAAELALLPLSRWRLAAGLTAATFVGVGAISQAMSQALATPLAKVVTRSEIDDVRFVRPDVAIVSSTKEVHDERDPSSEDDDGGSLASAGRLTYVMVKNDDAWRIALAQTTPIAS